MYDFDEINDILNEMAEDGILEPMIEPIDDPNIQTDFYDWADVVGVLDEIEPGVRINSPNPEGLTLEEFIFYGP